MEWKRKAISNNSLRLDGWMNGGTAARFYFERFWEEGSWRMRDEARSLKYRISWLFSLPLEAIIERRFLFFPDQLFI